MTFEDLKRRLGQVSGYDDSTVKVPGLNMGALQQNDGSQKIRGSFQQPTNTLTFADQKLQSKNTSPTKLDD